MGGLTEIATRVPTTSIVGPVLPQTDADVQLIDLWLHSRSPHTQRAYQADVDRFPAFVATPLSTVTLGDLQAFADALAQQELAPSWRVRTLAAVKSLLAFGQRTGHLPLNVGAALKLPPKKDRLAERSLSGAQVHRLLALEPSRRNQVLLRLLYAGGLRVCELAALRWRDLQPRDDAGQVTIFGKGGKTRVVLLPASVGDRREGLTALAAACARDPRSGAPMPHPPGAGHPWPRLSGHHWPLPARAADRFLSALPGGVRSTRCPRRRPAVGAVDE